MKVIEGTPAEILEYQKKNSTNDFALLARREAHPFTPLAETVNTLKSLKHYSTHKHEQILIKDMDAVYIMNVMRQLLNAYTSANILDYNREFKSLVLNLADKISEGL